MRAYTQGKSHARPSALAASKVKEREFLRPASSFFSGRAPPSLRRSSFSALPVLSSVSTQGHTTLSTVVALRTLIGGGKGGPLSQETQDKNGLNWLSTSSALARWVGIGTFSVAYANTRLKCENKRAKLDRLLAPNELRPGQCCLHRLQKPMPARLPGPILVRNLLERKLTHWNSPTFG